MGRVEANKLIKSKWRVVILGNRNRVDLIFVTKRYNFLSLFNVK